MVVGPPLGIFLVELFCPLSPPGYLTQPTAILSPGLFAKPHVTAISPCPYQQMCVSGCGAQDGCTSHQCMFHSVLPATDWLLCSPLSLRRTFPVPAGLRTGEGTPQVWHLLLSFSSLTGPQVPTCFCLFSCIFFPLFCPTQ